MSMNRGSGETVTECTVISEDFGLVSRLQQNELVCISRVLPRLRDDLVPESEGEMLIVDVKWGEDHLLQWMKQKEARFSLVVVLCRDAEQLNRCRELLLGGPDAVMCVCRDDWLQKESLKSDAVQSNPGSGAEGAGSSSRLSRQTVSVFNPKGGVGRTTTAVNLAVRAQAALGLNTCLIDLDVGAGDVAMHLDLLDRPTVIDLLAYGDDLSPQLVSDLLAEYRPSGLSVISAPGKAELVEVAPWERLSTVVEVCSDMFDLVVMDTPGHPACEISYRSAEAASFVLAPVTQDVAAPRRLKGALGVLKELTPRVSDRVRLLVNRQYDGALVSTSEIEEFLDCICVGEIPEAGGAAAEALSSGRPLVLSKGMPEIVEAFDRVLQEMFDLSVSQKRHTWWTRLLRGIAGVGQKGGRLR